MNFLKKLESEDDEIFMNKEGSIGGDIFNLELSDNGPNFCSIQKNVLNQDEEDELCMMMNDNDMFRTRGVSNPILNSACNKEKAIDEPDNRDKIEVITKMVSQSNIEEKNENSQEKPQVTDKEAIKLVDSIEENKSVSINAPASELSMDAPGGKRKLTRFGKEQDRMLFAKLKQVCGERQLVLSDFWTKQGAISKELLQVL
mmetsp:Transcript_23707/g.27265  ORF Transcript_23707/g.27265 Transcript_23707/m.27265 type:complete len:201 (+) Transcript_23707:21-623(+)